MHDNKTRPRRKSATDVETYYDGWDADGFYASIWGGEDIHIGIFEASEEPIREASRRTVATMAGRVLQLVLDRINQSSLGRPSFYRTAGSSGSLVWKIFVLDKP